VTSDPTFSLYRDEGNRFVQAPEAVGSCKSVVCTVRIRLLFIFTNELYRTSSIRVILEQPMAIHMKTEGSIRCSHGSDCEHYCLGFEVLTAVDMKSSIFWNVTPCNSLKVNIRFGRTCNLYLQDRRISKPSNKLALLATCFMLVSCLAYSSTLKMEANVLPKRRLTLNGLDGVISEKLEPFMNISYCLFGYDAV
jgi:hypothetical protein